jgi:DNA-binding response OmpR family regulator
VIIISAKDSLEDKIAGLDLGADDYLAKPFHLAELTARIKSVIRRKHNEGDNRIEIGRLAIYPEHFRVTASGKDLELNRKEYDILMYFVNRPNRLVDKSMLAEAVWGDHIDQVDNFDFIYAQIKNLRKKLKEADAGIELKAVYSMGYKLILDE